MSNRHHRKVFGAMSLPPPDSDSDDDLVDHFMQLHQNSRFGELVISSPSESPNDSPSDDIEGAAACAPRPQKKNKKKQNKANKPSTSKAKIDNGLDDIEQCLKEVNDLLGPPPEPVPTEKVKLPCMSQLLAVQSKYLNGEAEMDRVLGPEEPEADKKRQDSHARTFKKNFIVDYPDSSTNFHGYGLSMSVNRRENDIIYFTLDHSKKYQEVHRSFLTILSNTISNIILSREQVLKSLHIEGMLEIVDALLLIEEYTQAISVLEKIISIYQYIAHPNFTFTNPNIRLEYKYLENRPFFITLLKYIYILSNKFCHRTALELAKLLLSLDPSDPLMLFLIIDVVALRAREHQWLVDIIEIKGIHKNSGILVNINYSYALAKFHLAVKNQEDLTEANNLLRDAIFNCPVVVNDILDCLSGFNKEHIERHVLFSKISHTIVGQTLKDHTALYAKLVDARWREPKVLKWFLENLNHLVETLPSNETAEEYNVIYANEKKRAELYKDWPADAVRHMTIIKAMKDLIASGNVIRVKRGSASNPVPPLFTVDRYKYYKVLERTNRSGNSVWRDFFASVVPNDQDNVVRLTPHRYMFRNPEFRTSVRFIELLLIRKNIRPHANATCTLIALSLYLLTLCVALERMREPFSYSEDCLELE